MLHCRTLGTFELRGSTTEERLAVLSQPKRAALLVYLAVAKPRGFHRRDTLLALFWPDSDGEHARAALRQALTFLRRELGDAVVRTRNAADLAVDPERLWCDAAAFEDAVNGDELERALDLYQGDFLPGFHVSGCGEFERWLEQRRRELRDQAAAGAARLVERAESAGSIAEAVHWAHRHMALKPDDERAFAHLLRLLDRAGDRAAALKAYEAFATWLAAEYEAEPSPETQALVAQIRAREAPGSLVAVAPQGSEAAAGGGSPPAVSLGPGARVGPRRRPWRRALVALVPAALLGAILLLRPSPASLGPAEAPLDRTAIAVLPFENLSPDRGREYLARGLQDEILNQLARVGPIKVISRTSVMKYTGPNVPPLRQIARELGVGSVVEGSVQAVGERLRVHVELIDARTDRQLWAEQYDRKLDDAFVIESDVAQRIVQSVGAVLSVAEREGLARAPTTNAEAYQFYLQGRDYFLRPNDLRGDYEIAGRFFERALALDSGFALSHAALSQVDGEMYEDRYDPSPRRAMRQLREARSALRLAPDLPQGHIAMGEVHEYVTRDYAAALADYRRALIGLPNAAEVWRRIAFVLPRLGRWDEAIAAYRRAEQLSPRDATLPYIGAALTYLRLHRYADALQEFDRSLTLAPDLYSAAFRRAHTFVLWRGELDTLRAVIGRMPNDAELFAFGPTAAWHLQLVLWERQADSVSQVLRAAHHPFFESYYSYYPASLYRAWAWQLRGDGAAARAAFDSSRVLLDSVIRGLPEDWRVHAARGLALAGLGRRGEAVREARWLQQSFRYRHDALDWGSLAEERARILAQAGASEAALQEVEQLLTRQSLLTVHTLRLDPLWDPLRGNPRFEALLTQYASQ